jgi:glycosyltransferase involved in cell wall biosynthesis
VNVGVHTRYQPRESTYAAIQVADLARDCGNEVSVFTTTPRRPPVHARWDCRVVRDVPFTAWAASLDLIVWMDVPSAEQVTWAMRPRDGLGPRRTVLVADREHTRDMLRDVYPRFTHVVAPSLASATHLRAAGVDGVVSIPWSPRLPVTRRGPAPADVRLHFPLCTVQDRGQDPLVLDLVERLLRRAAPADVRVTMNGRSGEIVRRLERRAREYGRLTLGRCADFESLVLCLGEHDVTVLPVAGGSFGMVALCSLHAGVPVVTFDAVPVDEFVHDGRHGVLVRGTGVDGVDTVDVDRFEDALSRLLDRGTRLAEMQSACTEGLAARVGEFERAWAVILSEADRG